MSFEPILSASPAIQLHLVAALIALVLGIWIWRAPKGTRRHKMTGRLFAGFMFVTAVSAIFIREINGGQFSFIHLFVPLTFLGIFNAISGIRKGDIKRHKNAVKGMFFGALLIPGILSLMPGRRIWMVFFG